MPASLIELVDASAHIYNSSTDWVNYYTRDSVICAHKVSSDGSDIIVFRGTANPEEWMIDLKFTPTWHPQLGYCEAGFLQDMDDVVAEITASLLKPINSLSITGHSLGGARARIAAGLLTVQGIQVSKLAVFGSPKPAFINLARIIQKGIPDHESYRNRNDIVPTVPLTIEPVLDYVHTEQYTAINAAPAETNFESLRDHAIALYQQGIRSLVTPK